MAKKISKGLANLVRNAGLIILFTGMATIIIAAGSIALLFFVHSEDTTFWFLHSVMFFVLGVVCVIFGALRNVVARAIEQSGNGIRSIGEIVPDVANNQVTLIAKGNNKLIVDSTGQVLEVAQYGSRRNNRG